MSAFGKCHRYICIENKLQCTCFSFRESGNDDYLCGCCNHDRNFHEPAATQYEYNPYFALELPVEITNQSHPQTQVSRKNSKRNEFRLINLSNVGPNPKIPRR